MIYRVKYSNKFKKDLKKIKKRNLDINLLKDVVFLVSHQIALDKRYCLHMLSGEYRGYYECHIKPDCLLIYWIDEVNETLTLVRTGSHSDLF